MFLGKCVNHKTFRKTSIFCMWICSNFFHGRPKRRPKSDEGCRRHQRKTPPPIWLRLPGTASPDAAARSECWQAALGMAMCPMRRNLRRKSHNLTIILEPKKAFFGIRWTSAMQSQIWLKSTQPGTKDMST